MNDTQNFYNDILITAVEGGIGYWSQVSDYRPSEGTVTVHEIDEMTGETESITEVDTGTISEAIGRLVHPGSGAPVSARLRAQVFEAYLTRDAAEVDADLADQILQFGIFREVRYG